MPEFISSIPSSFLPFVGRETEQNKILLFFRQALRENRSGGVLSLTGEAGVGKTSAL
ncbi:MAG: ATP-binding protein [Candidatus Edwardsbacteria bacterium]